MLILILFARFFNSKKEGWHFYRDPLVTKEQPKTIPELKKQLQVLLDQAIWQPTPCNVLRYMTLQKMLMDKSEQFAEIWEQVLTTHPEFDPTIKNPTSYYGSLHAREEQEKKSTHRLRKHMKEYALFLVVGDDKMSAALTTVVQDMAQYRGYRIMIVNGQDQSQYLVQFGIKRLPALIMIHVPTGKRFLITYGLIGADKIEERMGAIIDSNSNMTSTRHEMLGGGERF